MGQQCLIPDQQWKIVFWEKHCRKIAGGQRGHTSTYTWVLDIFHLEEILLAAVVNMTHWGGFAMDTVWPHLPPSQQGWWKDINQLTLVSLVNVYRVVKRVGHTWTISDRPPQQIILSLVNIYSAVRRAIMSSTDCSSWYHNIVLKKKKVKVTILNLNTLFALKDH